MINSKHFTAIPDWRSAVILGGAAVAALSGFGTQTTAQQPSVGIGQSEADPADQRVPDFADGQFRLPPITAVSTSTNEIGNGRLPEGFRGDATETAQLLPESPEQRGMANHMVVKNWAAPNTFSYPRYFEDRMLERHGHERFGCLQSVAAGTRFFATFPILPYLTTISPPCECEYSVGYHRPGSCVPKYLQRPPLERRAAIAEGIAIGTGIAVLP